MCWWGCGEIRTFVRTDETVKWCHLAFSQNVKHKVTMCSNSSTPGYIPREKKTCLHKNLYINVRFSISIIEKWKQPKCPSTGRWMNWMWYNHTKEQFSAIKREGSTDACCNMDEPCKHAKWNKPDMKDHICMIPFIWSVQNRQVHWDRRVLPRAWDGGRISDR